MFPTSSFTRVSFATSTPPIQIASVVSNVATLGAVPSLNFSERAAGVFFLCAGGGDVANEVCGIAGCFILAGGLGIGSIVRSRVPMGNLEMACPKRGDPKRREEGWAAIVV